MFYDIEMESADFEHLRLLSSYIRPELGLSEENYNVVLDERLAEFAITRHRVGPILYKASKGRPDIDETAAAIVSSSYYENIRAILAQRAASQKLAVLLRESAIPFSFLKGLGVANQIYDDPNIRQSKDIDVLIPPSASRSAIQLLGRNGYVYKPYTLKANKSIRLKRQLSDMKLFKDLTFVDPQYSVVIELHQRLFKVEPTSLTGDFNAAIKFQETPSIIEKYYYLYLILHGAVSLWHRLKWLMDLSLLVRNISFSARRELLKLSKDYHCKTAVVTSLRFVEEIFSGSLDDDWRALLRAQKADRQTDKLIDIFRHSLMTTAQDQSDLPEKRPIYFNTETVIFERQISIFRIVSRRVMASIAVRI